MFLYILGITLAIIGSVAGDFLVKQATQSAQGPDLDSFGGPWALLNPVKLFQFLNQISLLHSPKFWMGICLMTLHFGGYVLALRVAPITLVVPMMACTYIIDTILAKTMLHERVTLLRWTGVMVVVVGITLLVGWADFHTA